MGPISLYGKVPAQGDFVRVNITEPTALAFVQWLEEAYESLKRGGVGLPQHPTYFLFRAPGGRDALTGVFAPCQDSVGRTFPMALFASVDPQTTANKFPAVPVVFARFLEDATDVVLRSQQLTAAQLADQVRALQGPTREDFAAADDVCQQALAGVAAGEVMRRLFSDGVSAGKHYYAYRTFTDACAAVRGREPAKPGVTLDCPIASDVDLFAWLELARRALRWPAAPPFFWTEGDASRLLLSLGPAPSAALLYVARPEHTASKLWPLTTERGDAIQIAVQNLPPNHRRAIDEAGAPLESLVAALSS